MHTLNQSLVRKIDVSREQAEHAHEMLRWEWLLTNGLGGYASGTISGMVTRRYHGFLVAALPSPLGRVVMLNHLAEHLHLPDGRQLQISGQEPGETQETGTTHYVCEFRLEEGLPVWLYQA